MVGVMFALAGAGFVADHIRDDRGPLPTRAHLQAHGFAVWPEDTVQEGLEACADAEEWRFDATETAERYALDVLRYPEPHLSGSEPEGRSVQYGITDEAVDLGSIVELRKYDRCWFVVYVSPREGGFLPGLLFARDADGHPLLIIGGGSEIGYGTWETTLDGDGQQVIDPPDDLPSDATGHLVDVSTSKGINAIDAVPLGFVPEPATTDVRPLTLAEVRDTKGVCPGSEGYSSPQLALARLYQWTFGEPIGQRGRRPIFRGENDIEPLGGDQWLLRMKDMELRATVPELKQGCWAIFSLSSENLLDDLKVSEDSFTFDIAWGDAMAASITLSNARGGDSWRLERVGYPVTVSSPDIDGFPKERFRATVVLSKGDRIVAAQQTWFQAR